MACWRASGLTAAEFAAGRGYSAATLKWWSSRLKAPQAGEVTLARVVVRDRASAPPPDVETPISLELGPVRVVVRRGFDPEALRAVLEVVGAGPEAER